jgi:hypothetical protein
MTSQECPDCHALFSSDGSYRVHKHRYHRAVPQPETQQSTLPQPVIVAEKPEPIASEMASDESNTPSSNDDGAMIIGALMLGGIFIFGLIKKWLDDQQKPPQN